MAKHTVTLRKRDTWDYVYVHHLTDPVPTKQDKFKPFVRFISKRLKIYWDLYLKKKDAERNDVFEEKIRNGIRQESNPDFPYRGNVELAVAVTASQKRLNEIDIDNLLKVVLDSLKGVVYVSDTQVISVYGNKFPLQPPFQNSLMIGVRKINTVKDSLFHSAAIMLDMTEEVTEN
jgi:Holliday junction resolvase RusA-like endonuclease